MGEIWTQYKYQVISLRVRMRVGWGQRRLGIEAELRRRGGKTVFQVWIICQSAGHQPVFIKHLGYM